jgi:tRNA A37 threonylcarbamoyladenosine biosynthesis protein TsaE
MPEDTFDLGEYLGNKLSGGEIILLYGDLGAGKTLFT